MSCVGQNFYSPLPWDRARGRIYEKSVFKMEIKGYDFGKLISVK